MCSRVCCHVFTCVVFYHREIFEQDNYSPIPVENEEEYKAVISRFPFHDAEIEKVGHTQNVCFYE